MARNDRAKPMTVFAWAVLVSAAAFVIFVMALAVDHMLGYSRIAPYPGNQNRSCHNEVILSEKVYQPIFTKAEIESISGRPAPSEAERRIAARVVVRANKARKVQTPQWIKDLADTTT